MTLLRMINAANSAAAPPFSSLFGLARHVVVGGLAGLVAGLLVGGVGGRLFMRIAGAVASDSAQGATTEAGFTVGEVTLGGSLGLVIFIGILVGVVGAVLYLIFQPWLAWAGRWRGVVYGLLLFAAGSAMSDVMNPDNIDFFILGNEVLVVGMILALFVGFGVFMEWMFGILARRLPAADGSARWAYAFLAVVGAGAGALTTPFLLFNRSACDCDPPIVASGFVIVAAVGTLMWWWNTVHPNRLRIVAVALGMSGVTGAIVFGLLRALTDAIEIIN
ncbi:MAG: hypothetical protein OEX97_00685 [Acidimicrobiia bacterium]|nr:hypothetical protein [Acidimicrobiia bacterium]